MEFVILTGASRGLGAALAAQLLSPTRRLVCVARTPNPALGHRAAELGAALDYRLHDLADAQAVAAFAQWLGDTLRGSAGITRFVLINNAGVVEPIGRVESLAGAAGADALARALQVNVAAPMLLASAFLAATAASGAERRILNISSGAGRYPVAGWSAYCASKAALDLFTRCIALEHSGGPNPPRVCSLAPGIVDTAMQAAIRACDPADFPSVERFRQLKADGALAAPEAAAARILAFLASDAFGERELDDIREH